MRRMNDNRIGAGIAGAMLLGIAVIEFFGGGAPAAANFLTGAIGMAMLVASTVGLRLD